MRLLVPAFLFTVLAATALGASAAAQAQTPPATPPPTPEVSDERCLLVMIALSNADDETASRMGKTGALFFAGRLKGRDPNFDFAKLKSVAATMNAQTAQDDLQKRCGPIVTGALQQLETALGGAQPPAAKPGAKPSTPPPPKK